MAELVHPCMSRTKEMDCFSNLSGRGWLNDNPVMKRKAIIFTNQSLGDISRDGLIAKIVKIIALCVFVC